MTPAFLALIEEFGPEAITLVEELITTLEKKGTVSTEEWAAIKAKGGNKAQDLMLAQLQKAGIDPASDQGKALLAAATGS
jgi:hypothetical protein